MGRMKKLVCVLVTVTIVLSASAVSIFGQTRPVGVSNLDGISFDRENSISHLELRINRTSATIGKGKTLRLKAFGYHIGGRRQVRWSTSNRQVAMVSKDGVVTGIKPGRVKIRVSLKSDPTVRTVCNLTVGYNIKYCTNGGKLAKGTPKAYYNEKVKLSKPSRKGYAFKGWYTDKNFENRVTVIDEDADRNYVLYAKWKKRTS